MTLSIVFDTGFSCNLFGGIMLRFFKTCLLLSLFMTVKLYGVDYSFCVKDSGFQRILLLSSFVDSLQYQETFNPKQMSSPVSTSSGDSTVLEYFRIFRVKSGKSSRIEGYVFIIEDNGVGSVVVPIRRIDTPEDNEVDSINEFIFSSIKGVMSDLKGSKSDTVSIMVSKAFIDLFNRNINGENKRDTTTGRVDDNYVLKTVTIDLDYKGDYIFEEISSVSFECESLVNRLVFSDEYDIEIKLLQLKSISFDFGKLVTVLQQRYNQTTPDPHSMNGKFHPNMLDYIQAAFIGIEYEKLVFYGYLREKKFKIPHIYSLLHNRYMKEDDSRSMRSGFIILESLISYLTPEELDALQSLILEDDLILRLIKSGVSTEVKNKIFTKLLVGSAESIQKMVYKIVETYSNLNQNYTIDDMEQALLKSIISSLVLDPNIDLDFLAKLKFMVFKSKRANTIGVDLTRMIFEVQKMKKCTLKFSTYSP